MIFALAVGLTSLAAPQDPRQRLDAPLREDFREVAAHIPATTEDLTNPRLDLRLLGPGREQVKLSHHPEVAGDPHYLWNGACTGPVLIAFEFDRPIDLSNRDAGVRLVSKNAGESTLQVALKVDGQWFAYPRSTRANPTWTEHRVLFGLSPWTPLDPDEPPIRGAQPVPDLDRSAVEALGFWCPRAPDRSKDCIRLDWFEIHDVLEPRGPTFAGTDLLVNGRGDWIEPEIRVFRSALVLYGPPPNRTRRGVVVKADGGRKLWGCFDTDLLRWSAFWTEDSRWPAPVTLDSMAAVSYPQRPEKAKRPPSPAGGSFLMSPELPGMNVGRVPTDDPRTASLADSDDRVGPLPIGSGRWIGYEIRGAVPVLEYWIGDCRIRESLASDGLRAVERRLELGRTRQTLSIRLASEARPTEAPLAATIHGSDRSLVECDGPGITLRIDDEHGAWLEVAPSRRDRELSITYRERNDPPARRAAPLPDSAPTTPLFPIPIDAPHPEPTPRQGPFEIRNLRIPQDNLQARFIRPVDVAFLAPGTALLCTLDGDLWRLDGVGSQTVRWLRVAAGLFEPMAVEVDASGRVFVLGRDQVTELVDVDGDHHYDRFLNASDAFRQTLHTRDYATSLALEPDGSFVVAKGGIAGTKSEGTEELADHRGTILRLSADGSTATVLAEGLRMPFVGRRADGALFASDQQGHFIPSTPLHRIGEERAFLGFEPTRFEREAPHLQPLTWYPYQSNRSGAAFATLAAAAFPDLAGAFVHLSWNGRLFAVETPEIGLPFSWRLPLQLDFPALNAASDPETGELLVVGLGISGYQPTTPQHAGLALLRQSAPLAAPTTLEIAPLSVRIGFAQAVPARLALGRPTLRVWNLRRSENYGSGHYDWRNEPGEELIDIETVTLSPDRLSLRLDVTALFSAHVFALDLPWIDAETGLPQHLELLARPNHLPEPTARQLEALAAARARNEAPVIGDARRGKDVYTRYACIACHALDGTRLVGPPLDGVAKRHAGEGLDAYLRESILQPAEVVADGYVPAMPSFEGVLPAQDLEDLVEWLKTLK